ncbi:hypothetical protein AFLA_012479 [Aspergillus flavus NRRL3357]|nr:hypothetical protein AFLA_012479 [Aspergillus flavus NRRL3357]
MVPSAIDLSPVAINGKRFRFSHPMSGSLCLPSRSRVGAAKRLKNESQSGWRLNDHIMRHELHVYLGSMVRKTLMHPQSLFCFPNCFLFWTLTT